MTDPITDPITDPVAELAPPDRAERERALICLNLVTEPGDRRIAARVRRSGPVTAWRQVRLELSIDDHRLAAEALRVQLRDAVEQAAEHGITALALGRDRYPTTLLELGAPPLALWAQGNLDLLADLPRRSVAVVGSRAATSYGERVATEWSHQLAQSGVVVVSGGAYGIDAAAHRGALASGTGRTVIVSAGGLDRPYPAGNQGLFERVAEAGGLVLSEAAPGRGPTRARFLVRNRVIAALSGGTVVVEAARRSGSINTAEWCRTLARPLMAAPGPVTSATSTGVHELIRGGAGLVMTVEDILAALPPH